MLGKMHPGCCCGRPLRSTLPGPLRLSLLSQSQTVCPSSTLLENLKDRGIRKHIFVAASSLSPRLPRLSPPIFACIWAFHLCICKFLPVFDTSNMKRQNVSDEDNVGVHVERISFALNVRLKHPVSSSLR